MFEILRKKNHVIFFLTIIFFLLFYYEVLYKKNYKVYQVENSVRLGELQTVTTNKFSSEDHKYVGTGKESDPSQRNKKQFEKTAATVNCGLWNFKKEWKEITKPQIPLNPKRLLYPGLLWGPNNQYLGFKQSIYLAIKLNRTIVIPRFRPQKSDDVLSAFQTTDIKRLCGFVSCVTIEEQNKFCNGSFHVALQGMNAVDNDVRRYEKDTGMNIIDVKEYSSRIIVGSTKLRIDGSNLQSNIPALPGIEYKLRINSWISADSAALEKAFETSAACAIFVSVFRPMNISSKDKLAVPLENGFDVRKYSDEAIYFAVTDALRHPPCIVKATEKYTKDVLFNKPFVAVHWRYNKEDWGNICLHTNILTDVENRVCKNVFKLTPVDVAAGIVQTLTKQRSISDGELVVYIASPPSLGKFVSEVYSEISKLNKRFVKNPVDLKPFLYQNFEKCWKSNGWTHYDEIISMVEMEIMRKSSWFFYSLGSTWSDNVRPMRGKRTKNQRIVKKAEFSIFDAALKAMRERSITPQ